MYSMVNWMTRNYEEGENDGKDSKKKWPKIPGSGNNGFGFQRFQ